MQSKKVGQQLSETIRLAAVIKEMAKPRMARSARIEERILNSNVTSKTSERRRARTVNKMVHF
jgi:hypothetical protein